jgi:two-component system chemotaxis response regulator CheY
MVSITQNFHVLLVDDSRSSRIYTQGILNNSGIEKVWHADDGQQALSILQENPNRVSCIISDFNMPIMHGLTMVKHIRTGQNNICRDIPIMMLTGYSDRNLLGIAIALDVNAFIVKPPRKDTFGTRIRKMMQMHKSHESWLKPVESYLWIDTDTNIQSLLNKPQVKELSNTIGNVNQNPGNTERSVRITNVIDNLHRKQEIERKCQIANEANSSSSANDDPASEARNSNDSNLKCVRLKEVPINAILAQDIISKNQIPLLRKNVTLTADLIERLKDLKFLDESVDPVWIYKSKQIQ